MAESAEVIAIVFFNFACVGPLLAFTDSREHWCTAVGTTARGLESLQAGHAMVMFGAQSGMFHEEIPAGKRGIERESERESTRSRQRNWKAERERGQGGYSGCVGYQFSLELRLQWHSIGSNGDRSSFKCLGSCSQGKCYGAADV